MKKIIGTIVYEGIHHKVYSLHEPNIKRIIYKDMTLFDFRTIKEDGNKQKILTTYLCNDVVLPDGKKIDYLCGFTPDIKDIPISEGELLTIQTIIPDDFLHVRVSDPGYSYIFTFLIELDPIDD